MPLRGPEGFELHYRRSWADRWPGLRTALLDKNERFGEGRVVRPNRFADPTLRTEAFQTLQPGPISDTFVFDRSVDATAQDGAGLALGYVQDPASILAVRALPLDGAERILDLCAAPGGKALVLAEQMPPSAELTLNDRSSARTQRLRRVVQDYLPKNVRERVEITQWDGRRVGLVRKTSYDRILVDAPCSSEAHVLGDATALEQWSERRIERLVQDQYALLTSALLALRTGGLILYATCALNAAENDGVIQRLVDRGRHGARPVPLEPPPLAEATTFGFQILPDRSGFGPLYWCLLEKE